MYVYLSHHLYKEYRMSSNAAIAVDRNVARRGRGALWKLIIMIDEESELDIAV